MQQKILMISNVTANLVNFRKEIIERLLQRYEVIVLATENIGRDTLERMGCRFISIDVDRHGTNPLTEILLIKRYKEIIKSIKPIVTLTYTVKPNVYGGIACANQGVPYIANITGLGDAIESPGILSLITRLMYKYGLRKAEKVFFQNSENCSYFVRHKIYQGRYDILPGSGVNLKKHKYEQYPEDTNPLVISVIGRITEDKGISEIIEASRHFKSNELLIQLIGACEGDYIELLKNAELTGNIKYVGRQENIHEWIKNSHAILHASYHEGMSNVLLEAAACGRPVIATNVPGCKETFDDGVSGIGFEPRNVDSLVEAVNHFIGLPYKVKEQMGVFGRTKMVRQFDREIVVNKYIDAIESLERKKKDETP